MVGRSRGGRRFVPVEVDPVVPAERVRGLRELESSVRSALGRMGEIEGEVRRLQAEQVRCAVRFVWDQQEVDRRCGLSFSTEQDRVLVSEVAAARGTSTVSASSWLSDAFRLGDELPATLAALERGEVSWWAARSIAREVGFVDDLALRALADEVIAEEAPGLLPGQVKELARMRVVGIDPESAERRATVARADRYVSAVAGESGAGFLTAALPAEQVAACWSALNGHATAVYAGGDPAGRSVSAIMCDTLVERLTGVATGDPVHTRVELVMDASTLLGLAERPARLVGLGPVPPRVARFIAASGDAWVRRLFCDPVDCSVLVQDSRARRFTGPLKRLILGRDQTCRGPGCGSRIKDIDHLVEHANGGRTSRRNGQGLSKGCHLMRDHPGVGVAADPASNAITWTLPSGASVTTLPPPALGHGSLDRDQLRRRAQLTRAAATSRQPDPPR